MKNYFKKNWNRIFHFLFMILSGYGVYLAMMSDNEWGIALNGVTLGLNFAFLLSSRLLDSQSELVKMQHDLIDRLFENYTEAVNILRKIKEEIDKEKTIQSSAKKSK